MGTVHALGGKKLHEVLEAATAWLERNADLIDSLNVFPVPDGDTGSNLALSMRAGVRECAQLHRDSDASAVARAFARGTLVGARGSSGVILSQLWQGLAVALDGRRELSSAVFAAALQAATRLATAAVARPADGTILTVMRDLADAAAAASPQDGDLVAFLREMRDVAGRSVARTPDLLPMLREAGVVDAGAQGLFVILEGAVRHLESGEGRPAASVAAVARPTAPEAAPAARTHGEGDSFGCCTEFLLQARHPDPAAIRGLLEQKGTSVIVIGGPDVLRVHVHTNDPAEVLRAVATHGELRQVRIRDMDRQHADLARPEPHRHGAAVAVIAAVCGEGLADIFRSLGASAAVCLAGDPVVAAGRLLGNIESAGAPSIILLAAGAAASAAAEAAVREVRSCAPKRVVTVSSRNLAESLAAMVAFTGGGEGVEETARRMTSALATVRCIEVRRVADSAEDARLEALLDGAPVAEGAEVAAVVARALHGVERAGANGAGLAGAEVLTLLAGAGLGAAEADAVASRIRAAYPGLRLECLAGGQPESLLAISIEAAPSRS